MWSRRRMTSTQMLTIDPSRSHLRARASPTCSNGGSCDRSSECISTPAGRVPNMDDGKPNTLNV